jgi:hypothetical protein
VGLLIVASTACMETSSSGNNGSSGGASSSSSGGSRRDGGGEPIVEDLAPDSSPLEERSSLCEIAEKKGCQYSYESVEECERALLGTNAGFVDAMTKCVESSATCDWPDCWEKTKSVVAPGYPDVPLINDCKEKNAGCEYTQDPATSTEKRKEALDTVCERLVVLDEKRVAVAKDCQAKDCDTFAQCIVDATNL